MGQLIFGFYFSILTIAATAADLAIFNPEEDVEEQLIQKEESERYDCSICQKEFTSLATDIKGFFPTKEQALEKQFKVAPINVLCKRKCNDHEYLCYSCADLLMKPKKCPLCREKLEEIKDLKKILGDHPYATMLEEDRSKLLAPIPAQIQGKRYMARFFVVATTYPFGERSYEFFVERDNLPYPEKRECFLPDNLPTLGNYKNLGIPLMTTRWKRPLARKIVDMQNRNLGTLYSNIFGSRYTAKTQNGEKILKVKSLKIGSDGLRHARIFLPSEGKEFGPIVNIAPKWDRNEGAYSLCFRGRANDSAEENIIFAHPDIEGEWLLQVGKVKQSCWVSNQKIYTVDASWPLSPFAAFAFAIARLEPYWKIEKQNKN